MKVVGYIRVSTEQQTEKYGIPRQEEAIQKYCRTRLLDLEKIFIDAGKSGTMGDEEDEPKDRPQLQEMMEYLMEHEDVEMVIVIKVDRLWRNLNAEQYVRKRLLRLKTDIVSIEESDFTLFPDSASRKFVNRITAAVAEFDCDNIRIRLAQGRTTKATTTGSKPSGTMPFGYAYSADKKNVLINQSEARIVKEAFQMKQSGKPLHEIVTMFSEKNYRNRNNKPFSKQAISYILKNPFYCGILTHAGQQIKGSHQPLISRQEWQRLNPDYVVEI